MDIVKPLRLYLISDLWSVTLLTLYFLEAMQRNFVLKIPIELKTYSPYVEKTPTETPLAQSSKGASHTCSYTHTHTHTHTHAHAHALTKSHHPFFPQIRFLIV